MLLEMTNICDKNMDIFCTVTLATQNIMVWLYIFECALALAHQTKNSLTNPAIYKMFFHETW